MTSYRLYTYSWIQPRASLEDVAFCKMYPLLTKQLTQTWFAAYSESLSAQNYLVSFHPLSRAAFLVEVVFYEEHNENQQNKNDF